MSVRLLVWAGMTSLLFSTAATAQYGYYNNGRGNHQQYGRGYEQRNDYQDYGGSPGFFSNSILSFAPIQITENGFGMGMAWERSIDRQGWVAFQVPAMLTFNLSADKYTGLSKNDPMFYVMPGIKIYTNLNSYNWVKYAIGPSLVIGTGRGTVAPDYHYYSEKQARFLLGAMGNVSANLFPAPHLYLGAEYGLGFSYINSYGGYNRGMGILTQLSLKIGYTYSAR